MRQDIDFLPASYRQSRHRRKRKAWRRSILVVFLLLVGVGAFQQRQQRLHLEETRTRLRRQADEMHQQLESPDVLRKEIQRLEAQANLLTHLRVRIPPTRILATITNVRPEFVSLSEIRFSGERAEKIGRPKAAANPTPEKKDDKPSHEFPEQLDLERLQSIAAQRDQVVMLVGTAPNDVVVSRYLAALQESKLFDDVRLLYSDHQRFRGHDLRSFSVRLRLKRPVQPAHTAPRPDKNQLSHIAHQTPLTGGRP